MTKENLTFIQVVLDRSGSMSAVRDATIEGLNAFITQQRESKVGEARMSLVQFDEHYEPNYFDLPLSDVPLLSVDTYQPRGMTALYDSVYRAIGDLGVRLAAMPESERPSKVVFVIQTDGFENASRIYSSLNVADAIKHQQTAYSWEFIFLAANQDAMLSGAALGIDSSHSLSYSHSPIGATKGFSAVSASINSVRGGQGVNYGAAGSSLRAMSLDDNTTLDSYNANIQQLVTNGGEATTPDSGTTSDDKA